MNYADEQTIRAALLDIIDSSEDRQFAIYHPFEDEANSERLRMADDLVARVQEMQEAPLQNLCDKHKRKRLPPPTASYCLDCDVEGKRALGHSG